MYNLSEQPVRKIVKEMSDFSSLKKIGIFTVKEKFNIKDTYYEVGDLVAIRGQNADEISIIPYDRLKEYSSYLLADDNELNRLFNNYFATTLSDFHKRFEFSEPETDKIETIMKEIKLIVDNQKAELPKSKLAELDYGLYFFSLFLVPVCGLVLIFLSDTGVWGYLGGSIMMFIASILWGRVFLRSFKTQKINKIILDKLLELDKRRIDEGTYIH